MIHIFTPSFADEADSNAQNLSVKEIVSRLSPNEFRVSMFYEGAPDPRVAARPNTNLLPWRRRGNTARTIASLLREPPDIYFFPREGPLDAAFLRLQPLLFRKTAIVTYIVSGGLYNPEPVRGTMVRNVTHASVVVGNNTYLSELVSERLHVFATTIYDGVDRRYFYPADSASDPRETPVVLFAGSLRPYKRPMFAMQLAASRPNVRFHVAGTGEEEAACRTFVDDHALANVHFLGHLSSVQLGDEMRRSSILLHPSILEGHPQVFIQAAACGLPVVALNLYRPDFVVDGETGFLAANDAELEQRLNQLLADAMVRQSMSQKSIAHALKFDWDDITALWRQTFLDVLARDEGRA